MSEPIRAFVLTISDRCFRGEAEDGSGKLLVELLQKAGAEIVGTFIVDDDTDAIIRELTIAADLANLVVTTGGTGFAPRDNTPEATLAIIDREAPGLAEAMRMKTIENTKFAMLSRGVCGIRGKCLIVNLPGSPTGVEECFAVIEPVMKHAIDQISGHTRH